MKSNTILIINPWIYDFACYDLWLKPLGLLYIASILRENGYNVKFVDCMDKYHPGLKSQIANRKQIPNSKSQIQNEQGNTTSEPILQAEVDTSISNAQHSIIPTFHHSNLPITNFQFPKVNEYGCSKFPREIIQKPDILSHIPIYYCRYGIKKDIFIEEIKKLDFVPSAIITSTTMTYWYPGLFDAIGIVKEIFPPTPVILGGIYATLCEEHAKKSGADYINIHPSISSLRAIESGVAIPKINNEIASALPRNDKKKQSIETKLLELLSQLTGVKLKEDYQKYSQDLDFFPYPAFDLLRKIDYIPILTSRGCPFRCSYCATNIFSGIASGPESCRKAGNNLAFARNPGFSQRDPYKVIEEIEYWYKNHHVKNFAFYDDALLVNPEDHFIKIMNLLIERKVNAYFHTPNGLHAKFLTKEVAETMQQAGMKTIRLGFDEGIKGELKVSCKDIETAVENLQSVGYKNEEIGIYILVGLPEQTVDEVISTINYVKEMGAKPILTEYSPIPHTADWEQARQIFKKDPALDPLLHNNTILPYQSPEFTPEIYRHLKKLCHK